VNGLRPAEQLLQSLGITDPHDIDLEAIAFDQGAMVKHRPLNGCEARILGYGDRAVITVDNRHLKSRVRFSTAHELGHWHSHRGRSLMCRPEDIGNPSRNPVDPERVADSYAADLLLPRYLFVPRANSLGKITFEALDKLTVEFATSMTATAIRLVEYGPEPAMLVCHSSQGRKWFNRPRRIPERWFPRDELDSDSYAFEVLHGDLRRSRRVLMGADAWFDRREADQFQLYEQTFKVADDEIITILIFKDEEMLEDIDY
jgi:Zn-dependent peptidase ImmA (M78 family)